MISAVKKILPTPVKKQIRSAIKWGKYNYRKQAIKTPIANNEVIKVIVGAAETKQNGWYSTNEQWLDITKEADWQGVFQGKPLLSHVVAEHVFEHLTKEQCAEAFRLIFAHLIDEGRVRIAVPDGYNQDPVYLKHVGIKGIGDDAADHKQLLNADTLMAFMEKAGFETQHIEGYTKDGELVQAPYKTEDGFIMRSRAKGAVQDNSPWAFPDSNTSLIVDGVKRERR